MTKHHISAKPQQFRKDVEPVACAIQKQETPFREEPNQQSDFFSVTSEARLKAMFYQNQQTLFHTTYRSC